MPAIDSDMVSINPSTDALFGDDFVDISIDERRWIRASKRVYDRTGAYVFIKLFKNENGAAANGEAFEKVQQVCLTLEEFKRLMDRRPFVDKVQSATLANQSQATSWCNDGGNEDRSGMGSSSNSNGGSTAGVASGRVTKKQKGTKPIAVVAPMGHSDPVYPVVDYNPPSATMTTSKGMNSPSVDHNEDQDSVLASDLFSRQFSS